MYIEVSCSALDVMGLFHTSVPGTPEAVTRTSIRLAYFIRCSRQHKLLLGLAKLYGHAVVEHPVAGSFVCSYLYCVERQVDKLHQRSTDPITFDN